MDDQQIRDLLNEIKIPEHDARAPMEAMKAATNVMEGMKTASGQKSSKNFQGKSEPPGQTRKEPGLFGKLFGGKLMTNPVFRAATAFVGVGAVIGSLILFTGEEPKPPASALRAPAPLTDAPGRDIDPAYEEALKEKNKQRVERAAQTGASAIPTPVGGPREPIKLPTEEGGGEEYPLEKWRKAAEARKKKDSLGLSVDANAGLPKQPEFEVTGQEEFEDFKDSPIKLVAEEPVSTFSADVDTASYSFVRRTIMAGGLPQKDAVRVEELINYFKYDYAPADSVEEPFKPTFAVYPSPWNESAKLLHIGIRGYEPDEAARPTANLVFLIDTSGSMRSADKLPLLQDSFLKLVDNLRDDDTVSIVTYAGSAAVVLEPTNGSDKEKIKTAIRGLRSGGSTAGAEGIKTAYSLARINFDEDALNRVILATDGDFNVGITNNNELQDFVERKRKDGIFLSVLGFGRGNYKDNRMQTLAQNGNGVAYYIDGKDEADKVFGSDLMGTLYTIAKDVKFQIEFNPQQVKEYRLIGYETRELDREDFNNDKVDAGDIGAGHTVTAIYEYIPAGTQFGWVDENRYSQNDKPAQASETDFNDEIAFLKMRYKLPKEDKSRLITRPVTTGDVAETMDTVSADMRFAASVAAFGQKLRGGEYTGDFSWEDVRTLAENNIGEDKNGLRKGFIEMLNAIGAAEEKQKIRDEIMRKQQEIMELQKQLIKQ